MKKAILAVFALYSAILPAQVGLPGARGQGMGGAGLGLRDINSALANPAGLAHLESFQGMALAENRYLLSEIRSVSGAAALPAGGGVFGLSAHYFGFELYNEQRLGLAYARRLAGNFSLGAQFFLHNVRIPDYGSRAVPTFELGAQAELSPQLLLGARLSNPMRVAIIEEEYLPATLAAGLAYLPSDILLLALEIEKDIDFPARVKSGLEYRPAEALALRVGVSTQPAALHFGMGLRLTNGVSLDFAASGHQYLGFSPAFAFVYQRPR
jgi:hypothetical protein